MATEPKPGEPVITYLDADMVPLPGPDGAKWADVLSLDDEGGEVSTLHELGAGPDESAEHPAAGKIRDLVARSKAGSLGFDELIGETRRIREHHGFEGLGAGAKSVGVDPTGHTDRSLVDAVRAHVRKQAPGRG